MKYLGVSLVFLSLVFSSAQEFTAQDFRAGEVQFTVETLELTDGGVTLSVTVNNGSGDAIKLNREKLEPLLINDKGESAFATLPEATEVEAGASATLELQFPGLSGSFFTLAFNAPKDLIISGSGEWPVYYAGPILTEGVAAGTQTGSQELDLAVVGDLSDTGRTLEAHVESIALKDGRIVLGVSLTREEGDDVTSVTNFAYLGADCYAPTRVSLTDANGTVYVPDYSAGLLETAPELTVSESVGEPSYSGELQFVPLLENTAGPLTLNFNACIESNAQAKGWSPSLSLADIPLPAQ